MANINKCCGGRREYRATVQEMEAFDKIYFMMCKIVDDYCSENFCTPKTMGKDLDEQYDTIRNLQSEPTRVKKLVVTKKQVKMNAKGKIQCKIQGKEKVKKRDRKQVEMSRSEKINLLLQPVNNVSCQLVAPIVIEEQEQEQEEMDPDQKKLLLQKQREIIQRELQEKLLKQKQDREKYEQDIKEKQRKEMEEKLQREKQRKEMEEKKVNTNPTKTALCDSVISGKNCRHGSRCKFAHKFEEICKIPCKNITNCWHVKSKGNGLYENSSERICKFWHLNETINSYFTRQGVIKNKR